MVPAIREWQQQEAEMYFPEFWQACLCRSISEQRIYSVRRRLAAVGSVSCMADAQVM